VRRPDTLRNLIGGYLNEDWPHEGPDPTTVLLKGFGEHDPLDQRALLAQLRALRDELRGHEVDDAEAALRRLGMQADLDHFGHTPASWLDEVVTRAEQLVGD
jgi:hypothetical protein